PSPFPPSLPLLPGNPSSPLGNSIGGPFPVPSHRCHHKQKHCPPVPPGGGLPATPLLFHPHTKGSQILMDLSHKAVKRQASFCNAITFSNRPVLIYEQVRLKITKKQCCWSGALRLGFTSKDPSRIHPDSLPKYACPDLVSQSGFWAKALPEEFANEGNIIAFWVDKKGRVFYRINDSAAMLFFNGVRTADPLWALVDVYGLTRGVQLLGECPLPVPLRCGTRLRGPSGDILGLAVNADGELHLSHNGAAAGMQLCVDASQPLWMLFGLHGAVTQIRILGSTILAERSIPSLSCSPASTPTSPSAPGSRLSDPLLSTCSSGPLGSSAGGTAPNSPVSLPESPVTPGTGQWSDECTICYEHAVDTVIYTCGHMCLCYACGLRLKKALHACCPICRRPIKDIIKTYRSS
uniref:RING-type E3 ubiquitin transferase n=1 Tax=Panthera tigris altaica TaxID=74533 RepID=A0A8C9MA12_PANTA